MIFYLVFLNIRIIQDFLLQSLIYEISDSFHDGWDIQYWDTFENSYDFYYVEESIEFVVAVV